MPPPRPDGQPEFAAANQANREIFARAIPAIARFIVIYEP